MPLPQWFSARGHVSFSAALWGQASSHLRTFTGAACSDLTIPEQTIFTLQNLGPLDFTPKGYKDAQDPQGVLSVKHLQCVI